MGVSIPAWAYEFHGHKCPFMPLGYRMGIIALRELGLDRIKDHDAIALTEMGIHPQNCMNDGIQIATGCTYGKLTMEKLHYGKAAFVLYHPERGAVRVAVKAEFFGRLNRFRFFSEYRVKGIEPSFIPEEVADETIEFVLNTPEEEAFIIQRLPDFQFKHPPSSFKKDVCESCGEMVFESYLRFKDGKMLCIPCSGYRA
ncbi:FmdE family protein [Desulfurispora thermophila]|uniref:FmdE family protein n=1 Tax=Desulfurispora thermophila TaxID=265470 RepID=UPI0003682DCD|nr:FmdE family protein [Desulfurispora thermophila]